MSAITLPPFMHYDLSKDYELLYSLLMFSIEVPCLVNYTSLLEKIGENGPERKVYRDICMVKYNRDTQEIFFGVRGLGYASVFEDDEELPLKDNFIGICNFLDVQFYPPTKT